MATAEEVAIEIRARGAAQAASDFERVGRSARRMESDISGAANVVGKALVGIATGIAAIKVAQTGLTFANMRQQSELAFETMLGSTELARAKFQELVDFARVTPFTLQSVVEGTQKLLAFGFQAEETTGILRTVGDAMAGLGAGEEGINRAVRALGQMAARGKVASQEMMQLTELGVPAWQALAQAMGVDTAEAMKRVESGTVSAATGINAVLDLMDEKFAGLMDKQSRTLGGLANTLKDTFAQTIGTIAEPAVQRLTDAMQELAKFTETDTFQGWVENAKNALDSLLTILGPVVDFIRDDLAAALDRLGRLWEAAGQGGAAFGETLETMFRDRLSGLQQWIADNAGPLADTFTGEWVPAAVEWITEAAAHMVARMPQITYDIGQWIVTTGVPAAVTFGKNLATGLVTGLWEGLKSSVPTIGSALKQWWDDVTAHAQGRRTSEEMQRLIDFNLAQMRAAGLVPGPPEPPPLPEPPPPPEIPLPAPPRGVVTVPGGGALDPEKTKKAAETAIMGFMEALSANRANVESEFGRFGADAAVALTLAIEKNTSGAGATVAKALDDIIGQLREAGIPEWRQLGDELAGSFHDALVRRTDAATEAALNNLREMTARLRTEVTPETIMDALGGAIERAQLGRGGTILERFVEAEREQTPKAMNALMDSVVGVIRGLEPARKDIGDLAVGYANELWDAFIAHAEAKSPETEARLKTVLQGIQIDVPVQIATAQFEDAMARAETTLADALRNARDDAERQISDLLASVARERSQRAIMEGLAGAEQAQIRAVTAGFDAMARSTRAARDQRTFSIQTQRQVADLQQAHQQALMSLQAKGDQAGIAAENARFNQAMANLQRQNQRAQQDRALRAQDEAADLAFARQREQALEAIRQNFEQQRRMHEQAFQQEALGLQIDRIREAESKALAAAMTRFNTEKDEQLKKLDEARLGAIPIWAQMRDDFLGTFWRPSMQQMLADLAGLRSVFGHGGTIEAGEAGIGGGLGTTVIHQHIENPMVVGQDSMGELARTLLRAQIQNTRGLVTAGRLPA